MRKLANKRGGRRVVDPNATVERRRHELAALPPNNNGYLRINEVCAITSLSAVSIWRLRDEKIAKQMRFPAPKRLGKKRVAWLRSEVEEWLNRRPEARVRLDK